MGSVVILSRVMEGIIMALGQTAWLKMCLLASRLNEVYDQNRVAKTGKHLAVAYERQVLIRKGQYCSRYSFVDLFFLTELTMKRCMKNLDTHRYWMLIFFFSYGT